MNTNMTSENPVPKEATVTPEVLTSVPLAILLDVDGVVTDPAKKEVLDTLKSEMFGHMKDHLTLGNPVTLNTGRSNEWMIPRVIKPLGEMVADKSKLKNFFAVGEKGLTWVGFDATGKVIEGVFDTKSKSGQAIPVIGYDLKVFLDEETVKHFEALEPKVKSLIENEYPHSTFFDASKKAMISTEMHDGYNDHDRYQREQVKFTAALEKMVEDAGLKDKFRVDPTTIATDIQLPHANKALGAQRVLDWLKANKLNPQHYVAMGDSESDFEMADELHKQGKSVDFFYVHPKKALKDGKKPYPVEISQNNYGEGTVEMFRKLAARKPSYKTPNAA